MSKTTWADVREGAAVELGGRVWRVEKIKRKGKIAKVTVEYKGRTAKSEVRLKDRVTLAAVSKSYTQRMDDIERRHGPLHDERGTQQRWATEKERVAALGPGDPTQTEPPADVTGGKWSKPTGDAEKVIDKILGARLVGESTDEDAGYYVPPVDVTTVAAHLALFHGGIPDAEDEGALLDEHDLQHYAAAKGEDVLAVNHWHTERRP